MSLKRLSFLLVLLLASAVSAKADPIVLTFDDLTPGFHVGTTLLPGNPLVYSFNSSVSGNTFHSIVRVAQTGQATSPPNALFSSLITDNIGTRDSLGIAFDGPQFPGDPNCQPCTDFVSFNIVGTVSGQTEQWRVVFYSRQGAELFTVTGVTDQLVSFFSENREIGGVRIFTTNGGREGIDNLTYNSPIPEPATAFMLGTGLVGTLAAMRRRRWRKFRRH